MRHRRGRRELGLVRLVERRRLGLRDRDLLHHVLLLDAADDHLALDVAPQLGHAQPLLAQGRLELLLVLELVLLADVADDLRELLVRQLVAELAATLHQQQLVDRVHDQLRCHLAEQLP